MPESECRCLLQACSFILSQDPCNTGALDTGCLVNIVYIILLLSMIVKKQASGGKVADNNGSPHLTLKTLTDWTWTCVLDTDVKTKSI